MNNGYALVCISSLVSLIGCQKCDCQSDHCDGSGQSFDYFALSLCVVLECEFQSIDGGVSIRQYYSNLVFGDA